LSHLDKKELLNQLFNNNRFLNNLKSFNKLENFPLKTKVLLGLLKLKSAASLLIIVKYSEKIPRERIKKVIKN
jgi:hypothetical protein